MLGGHVRETGAISLAILKSHVVGSNSFLGESLTWCFAMAISILELADTENFLD
jgi:hypothetical protein